MTFAKLTDNRLEFCPRCGYASGRLHTDLPMFFEEHPSEAKKAGWLELLETPYPGGSCRLTHRVENGKILEVWEPVEPESGEPEKTIEERLDMIEEAVLDMSMVVYGGD